MVTFRNNNNNVRRSNFRRNDRNFKNNGDRSKFTSNYSNNDSFKRKIPGRNNHNASKLIEKYTNLAKEVLSGDLRGAWEVLTSGGVPSQVANAAGNAVRSLVTFAFGEEGANKLRGGARWASNTLNWLGSFGR